MARVWRAPSRQLRGRGPACRMKPGGQESVATDPGLLPHTPQPGWTHPIPSLSASRTMVGRGPTGAQVTAARGSGSAGTTGPPPPPPTQGGRRSSGLWAGRGRGGARRGPVQAHLPHVGHRVLLRVHLGAHAAAPVPGLHHGIGRQRRHILVLQVRLRGRLLLSQDLSVFFLGGRGATGRGERRGRRGRTPEPSRRPWGPGKAGDPEHPGRAPVPDPTPTPPLSSALGVPRADPRPPPQDSQPTALPAIAPWLREAFCSFTL